jgi:hypothetical protein
MYGTECRAHDVLFISFLIHIAPLTLNLFQGWGASGQGLPTPL